VPSLVAKEIGLRGEAMRGESSVGPKRRANELFEAMVLTERALWEGWGEGDTVNN
jgi:hypothetical protein